MSFRTNELTPYMRGILSMCPRTKLPRGKCGCCEPLPADYFEKAEALRKSREEYSKECALAGATHPHQIPKDVREKILKAKEALAAGNTDEAYHQLYGIADPTFALADPWTNLEGQ